ncbi:hypothetical protein SEA_LUCHADOR_47 [Mycobacterium phage Luchador]|uniref:Uncharacterized protein n=1 Tax=Mycobacterium phage Luchador TaxID=1647300 RepID=A0A0F6YPZ5_9CAUD|nr:hypothetical protein AVT52_gp57 [Mycobacterium phage Luchador]AKF14211.1 hypothetical protein SEA_LUCHADOR_47 [Mycobacterium phage Luchador]
MIPDWPMPLITAERDETGAVILTMQTRVTEQSTLEELCESPFIAAAVEEMG